MYGNKTFDDVLLKNKGIGPGFDLVRIGLAALIFFGHCFWVAGSRHAIDGGVAPAGVDGGAVRWVPLVWSGQTYVKYMLVPMFFAVSGFLVTGSAFRTQSLRTFLVFRVLRIAPALSVEVFLSALVLGPLLTSFALSVYFTDPLFADYFGNIVGRVRMLLPGVFLSNPATPAVNVNLWTLPAEFYCYLFIAVLIAFGLLARRILFSCMFGVVTVLLVLWNITHWGDVKFTFRYIMSAELLVYYFFCGTFIYHWRDKLPYSALPFALAAAIAYVLYVYGLVWIAPLFVSYVILCIGLFSFPRIGFLQNGDYSYGVYLYGFPIQQAIIATFPELIGHGWRLLFVSGIATFLFAVASWHLVEKPTLALKRVFVRTTAPAAPPGLQSHGTNPTR